MCTCTGWPFSLWRTFCCLQNKSSAWAWLGQASPKRNFCFEVNRTFVTSWMVTLYMWTIYCNCHFFFNSTNHIENYWGHCKRKLKAMVGVSETTLRSHINEFCWRHRNGRDGREVFTNIIRDIRARYNVNRSSHRKLLSFYFLTNSISQIDNWCGSCKKESITANNLSTNMSAHDRWH